MLPPGSTRRRPRRKSRRSASSEWADLRVRQAVNHALDRQAVNEAACLGYCPPARIIVPRLMDFALQVEAPAYDPKKAKQQLAAAGYPIGFGAGDFVPSPPFFDVGLAVVNYLNAVGNGGLTRGGNVPSPLVGEGHDGGQTVAHRLHSIVTQPPQIFCLQHQAANIFVDMLICPDYIRPTFL